jgi:DNA-directed RNA polymerase subunit N (RpoN/RPB10)
MEERRKKSVNDAFIDRGIYIDPSNEVITKIRCTNCEVPLDKYRQQIETLVREEGVSREQALRMLAPKDECCRVALLTDEGVHCEECAKPVSAKYREEIQQYVEEWNETHGEGKMTLERALKHFAPEECCQASLLTDWAVSKSKFNPEVEAGKLSVKTAQQQEEMEGQGVHERWLGHMKRTDYEVAKRDGIYYAVDPDTKESVESYPVSGVFDLEGDVARWVEIPYPNLANKIFEDKAITTILIPVLTRVAFPRGVSKQQHPYEERRKVGPDPLFPKKPFVGLGKEKETPLNSEASAFEERRRDARRVGLPSEEEWI